MKKRKQKRPQMIWLSGILIALSVHAAGLLLFRVEEEKAEQPEADYSFVSLPPGGEFEGDILHEWAYLLDSSPLYFPTKWNLASGPGIRALEERPDPLFASFPARLSYGDRDFGLGAIVTARMESPLEGLRAFGDFTHTVFGEGRVELTAARERFALLEVLAPDGGEVVLEKEISNEGAPEVSELWSPAEFLVQTASTGRLGEPLRIQGTGVEEVDQFLGEKLLELLSSRLFDPGYYRIRIGP